MRRSLGALGRKDYDLMWWVISRACGADEGLGKSLPDFEESRRDSAFALEFTRQNGDRDAIDREHRPKCGEGAE